jgi:nucleoside-diphosphate-sugar epimerase
MHSVFIVGCGDIGRRIARRLPGVRITGLVSGQSGAALLKSLGIMPVIANLDIPGELDDLDIEGQVVFYLAPPPGGGEKDTRMRHFLEAIRDQRPEKLVYISTSGVYGDCKGAWVSEEWPARPYAPRAKRRWDAEQQLLAWSDRIGVPVIRLRVGGIYAPDRLPKARIQKGLKVICPDEAPWSNRIHADDLARVCIAAAERGEAGEVYNAADGHPTSMTDYFFQVADFLGMPRPACVSLAEAELNLTPAMLSFVRESRRLDISRMKRQLKIELRYPILSEGLASQDVRP